MSVVPLWGRDSNVTAKQLLDQVLLEAHLRDTYGIDDWVEYHKLLAYIKELEEDRSNAWRSS